MTVRGIEAIKLYLPPNSATAQIDTNVREEQGRETSAVVAPVTMTSVERYRREWRQLLRDLDENPELIRDKAFDGDVKVSKFRSVHWALLLRVLNPAHRTWREQRQQQRSRYADLKYEFVKNPHVPDVAVPDDNPLSQATQSVWNQYFNDQELFGVIRQDVIRTFPGVDFFRKELIQNAMTNILFYYAREHPYMCYRQGMHEILAPILFVVYGDHQALLHFQEIEQTNIDATLLDVLDPKFLEADSYSIFSRLMASIESYYRISNLNQSQGGSIQPQSADAIATSSEVEVISQLNSIRDKILAKEDLHLHNYLLKLDIPLHIFGIRWLRLLFGREFPLLDLLVLWDAIFADSDRFDLPNYILVAMLIRIRDKLLLSDYTTCLTYLMRYPTNVDIHLILRHALHMQTPKKFERPPNAIVYFTMNPTDSAESAARMPSSTRKQPAVAGRDDAAEGSPHDQQRRTRSTSLNDAAKVEREISMLQARNAATESALAKMKVRLDADGPGQIMDGYSENSPELIRLELRNAQTVIKIAHNKLQTYLATVRQQVSKVHSEELSQALDGIQELCSFLDVKFMFPLHRRRAPIDQATEANEQQRQAAAKAAKTPPRATPAVRTSSKEASLDADADAFTFIDLEKDIESVAASSTTCGPNPFAVTPTKEAVCLRASYEKPDNGFMRNSARMLGQLKEIELIAIASDERAAEHLDAGEGMPKPESHVASGLPSVDPLRQHLQ